MVNGKGGHQETINNLLETHKALRNVKNDYFICMTVFAEAIERNLTSRDFKLFVIFCLLSKEFIKMFSVFVCFFVAVLLQFFFPLFNDSIIIIGKRR